MLPKFLSVGTINTLIGYAVIFGCMAAGVNPIASNVLGYSVGLLVSFVLSRAWVFGSEGKLLGDATRFVLSFIVAYSANIAVLWTALHFNAWPPAAQILGGVFYVGVMYLLSLNWVFNKH